MFRCVSTACVDMNLYSSHHRGVRLGHCTNAIAPLLHVQMYLHGVLRYEPVPTSPSGYAARTMHPRHPSIKKPRRAVYPPVGNPAEQGGILSRALLLPASPARGKTSRLRSRRGRSANHPRIHISDPLKVVSVPFRRLSRTKQEKNQ